MPSVYDRYQALVGAPDAWRWLVQQHMGVRAGEVVLDLGCGPGTLLRHLPDVDYIGLDLSRRYVEMARESARGKQSFYAIDVARVQPDKLPRCDWVVAVGLLHHLDDTVARRVLDIAAAALKPGGRFIAIDPCLSPGQSTVARWLIQRDRGEFVRDESAYRGLANGRFLSVQSSVHHDLLRIPYTQIVLDCAAPAAETDTRSAA